VATPTSTTPNWSRIITSSNRKSPVEGYHLTEDLVDKAISFIADTKQVAPNKPFFMYFATGAMHAPHHVTREWVEKYDGMFDDGWDAYREKVFAK
jgi:arylsulfatase